MLYTADRAAVYLQANSIQLQSSHTIIQVRRNGQVTEQTLARATSRSPEEHLLYVIRQFSESPPLRSPCLVDKKELQQW